MRSLLVLAFLVAAARPAAACRSEVYVSLFRRFDETPHVVRARVRAPRGRFALALHAPLKGKQTKKQIFVSRACNPHLRGTGLAFLTDDMQLIDVADSFTTNKYEIAALIAYAAATTDAERAVVLVEAALESPDPNLRFAAEVALAEDPAALVALTPVDRDRLIDAGKALRPSTELPIVLARLGVDATELAGGAAELAAERKFEEITKPAELADIIEAAAKANWSPRAVAALERCERIRKKRLANFFRTLVFDIQRGAADWHTLAEACRN